MESERGDQLVFPEIKTHNIQDNNNEGLSNILFCKVHISSFHLYKEPAVDIIIPVKNEKTDSQRVRNLPKVAVGLELGSLISKPHDNLSTPTLPFKKHYVAPPILRLIFLAM